MSNVVETYVPGAECSDLSSFIDDRRSFGHHGARRDTQVNNNAVSLVKEAHKCFSKQSTLSIARLLNSERVLGRLHHADYDFVVHIRTQGNAVLAFYSHRTDDGYQTYLMGVETNPPPNGEQEWWRSTIKPRLKELLGT